jgi:hypothetical protein
MEFLAPLESEGIQRRHSRKHSSSEVIS